MRAGRRREPHLTRDRERTVDQHADDNGRANQLELKRVAPERNVNGSHQHGHCRAQPRKPFGHANDHREPGKLIGGEVAEIERGLAHA